MRTEGRMTFASVPRVRHRLRALVEEAHPEVVILECSAIPDFRVHGGVRTQKAKTQPGIPLLLAQLRGEVGLIKWREAFA